MFLKISSYIPHKLHYFIIQYLPTNFQYIFARASHLPKIKRKLILVESVISICYLTTTKIFHRDENYEE